MSPFAERVFGAVRRLTNGGGKARDAARRDDPSWRYADRALRVLTKCNYLLARAVTEQELLDGVCRIIVEDGGYVMAWAGYAQFDAERNVIPVAVAGDRWGYLDSALITWADEPHGRGPSGTSIRTGHVVVARNISTDPNFETWRAAALACGFASSASFPLRDGDRTIGAICIYAPEPDAFDEREVNMLQSMVENVSHGVTALRTRKQHQVALEALRENEHRFRATFEQAAVGVCHIASDGRFLRANQRFCDLIGVKQGTLRRLYLESLIHPDDLAMARDERQRVFNGKIPSFSRELRLIHAEGHTVWVNETVSLVHDDASNYVIAVFQDLSEAKRLESELIQARKMEAVGQLTGGLAHDFNNLLGVVLGNLDVVHERLDEGSSLRELVARSIAGAERGAALVQRLLAFSRKQLLQPVIIDANDLITGMESLLRTSLNEAIGIDTRFAEALWPVLVDPTQLESALLNLALNGRDAMHDGGTLTITTANLSFASSGGDAPNDLQPGDYVVISVRDTGTGMTTDVRERAFEPFFTTKETGKGTGLGLSMVHGFVKQSGGTVAISSAVGAGTTVTIFLPRALPPDGGSGKASA